MSHELVHSSRININSSHDEIITKNIWCDERGRVSILFFLFFKIILLHFFFEFYKKKKTKTINKITKNLSK